jgi:hypothetical protein
VHSIAWPAAAAVPAVNNSLGRLQRDGANDGVSFAVRLGGGDCCEPESWERADDPLDDDPPDGDPLDV